MTRIGGDLDIGTVFSIDTNGTNFTLLREFAGGSSDGANPEGSLLLVDDTTLYGGTVEGGSEAAGIVFSINKDGTGFSLLHTFDGINGRHPRGAFVRVGEKIFATTWQGGSSNLGTIFSFNLPDTSPPTASSISPSSGSTIYTSTPTITFTTDEAAYCRAGTTDESYADMADNVDCTGDGTTSQSCTLSDLGASGTKNVYISCADGSGNEDTIATNENLTYTLDISAPTLSSFSPAIGSTTSNSKQTVTFATDEAATCRVSLTDKSYANMSEVNTCTGAGTTSQSCTMPDVASSGPGSKTIYIACIDSNNNADSITTNTHYNISYKPAPPAAKTIVPQILSASQSTAIEYIALVSTPLSCLNCIPSTLTLPGTLSMNAFVSTSFANVINSSGLLSNPITGQPINVSIKPSNIAFAGDPDGVNFLGIRQGNQTLWQVGKLQNIWYKAYGSDNSTSGSVHIIPELQSKYSTLVLKYDRNDLFPAGSPRTKFNELNLRIAKSIDGVNWTLLPGSISNPLNNSVSVVDRIGGYYMIVGNDGSLVQNQVLGATDEKLDLAAVKPKASASPSSETKESNKSVVTQPNQNPSFLQRLVHFFRDEVVGRIFKNY